MNTSTFRKLCRQVSHYLDNSGSQLSIVFARLYCVIFSPFKDWELYQYCRSLYQLFLAMYVQQQRSPTMWPSTVELLQKGLKDIQPCICTNNIIHQASCSLGHKILYQLPMHKYQCTVYKSVTDHNKRNKLTEHPSYHCSCVLLLPSIFRHQKTLKVLTTKQDTKSVQKTSSKKQVSSRQCFLVLVYHT